MRIINFDINICDLQPETNVRRIYVSKPDDEYCFQD